ncbi:hypothetical protein FOZ63_026839 [Perkinsus olseni]|uniref:Uncharacterized protein n=1 Tax=Perkinsus olseni TaxID=32597 RepID=A0A7J6QMN9_PEROL|nr:hypothetical protein FOZ63_026839 [Perkinsus olseni]
MTAIQADLRCSGEGLHFIRLVVSPVVGDRLVALEGQVRNLQAQVNSLRVSQPATASETAPDTRAQDERVLLEIQQQRSTVALLCDELKKVSTTASQQPEGDVPSSPTPIPVGESSHGEGNKPRKEDGSPPHPADPQQQQQREHVVDGEARPEDKSSVSRPARSSITSLPSRRPSSDVKEGYRRSRWLFVSPENPAWGMSAAGRSSRRTSVSSSAPGTRAAAAGAPGHGSISEGMSTLVPYDDLVDEAYFRINAQYGSLGVCVEALCTGGGTFDTSTRFDCLDFAAIIEQVGMTPKEGCRLFRILDTQRMFVPTAVAGIIILRDYYLNAQNKLAPMRSVTLQAATIVLLLLFGLGTMGLSLMTVHSHCPDRSPEDWAHIVRRTLLPVHIVVGLTLGSAARLLWLSRRTIERTDATEAKLECCATTPITHRLTHASIAPMLTIVEADYWSAHLRAPRHKEKVGRQYRARQWETVRAYPDGQFLLESNYIELGDDNQFCCTLCNKKSYGFGMIIESHCASDKHKRNVEWAARTNPPPTDRRLTDEHTTDGGDGGAVATAEGGYMRAQRLKNEEGWIVCKLCNKKFFDLDSAKGHCASNKHEENVAWDEEWEGSCGVVVTCHPSPCVLRNRRLYNPEIGELTVDGED